jgi:rhodanese-related sulfurtransferase
MDGEVTPETVIDLRADDDVDVCVVDVRSPRQFERAHIPDSVNVPLPELPTRVEDLPPADRVVTVCPHGKASVQAARLVASYAGVDAPVESMAGGLEAYDGPLDTDDGHHARTTDADGGDPDHGAAAGEPEHGDVAGKPEHGDDAGPDAPF